MARGYQFKIVVPNGGYIREVESIKKAITKNKLSDNIVDLSTWELLQIEIAKQRWF